MRIFVAGATGVIGRALVPRLVAAGHEVTGTTRAAERARLLRRAGARAVVLDAFDRPALVEAVVASRAEVVLRQLTDLAAAVPGQPFGEGVLAANARIRTEGTANLVAAAVAAGARRVVAQSIAWLYAPSPEPHDERDALLPLDPAASASLAGVHALEGQVLDDSRFEGVVLRYGRLYGMGTWTLTRPDPPTVSVDGAAAAAAAAVTHGAPGVYNIVDDGGPVANARARRDLRWAPA